MFWSNLCIVLGLVVVSICIALPMVLEYMAEKRNREQEQKKEQEREEKTDDTNNTNN